MVKAEEKNSMGDGWGEVFHGNRLVPPSSQTVRLAVENHLTASQGFQLSLSRLTAAHLPQVNPIILRLAAETCLCMAAMRLRLKQTS